MEANRFSPKKTLIFLHIHKTAGSTLNMILERQFPNRAVFPGSLSVHPNWRTFRILLGKRFYPQQIMAEFASLSEQRKREIRYLHHHLPFGVHTQLPQPSVYITMLRHPVERVVSLYYYLKRSTHIEGYNDKVESLNLEEFVVRNVDDDFVPFGNNAQVYRLSGLSKDIPPSDNVLELAKTNLQTHFIFAGLSERFNESLLLLGKELGWEWEDLLYFRRQVNPNKPKRQEIQEKTRKLIEKYNELDLEFYEYIKKQFNTAVMGQGKPFQDKVELFESKIPYYGSKTSVRAYNLLLDHMITANIWIRTLVRNFQR